jgi:hypothetical protein
MQKAHLYEAISLLNHGVDEAVRGLERQRLMARPAGKPQSRKPTTNQLALKRTL